jgi:hypothetical protein
MLRRIVKRGRPGIGKSQKLEMLLVKFYFDGRGPSSLHCSDMKATI